MNVMFDDKPPVADIIGVPQFFINEVAMEDLGDGNVQIAGCVLRNGILIPQYYVVMNHKSLIRCASEAVLAAQWVEQNTTGVLPPH